MNHLLVISIATALTGCLIVPTKKTTIENLGIEESGLIYGPPRATKVSAESAGDNVTVRASYQRECERRVLAVTRTITSTHARLGGSSDPRGRVFGALIAPLTIPVSAVITGVVVASADTKVERKAVVQSVKKQECVTVAANVAVELALPSGRTVTRTTDDRGMIELAIPETEPYRGDIVVTLGTASDRTAFERPRPAVTATRDATRACATRYQVTGALRLRITVDANGAPTHVGTDAGTGELATCVSSAIAKLRFPVDQRGATLVLPFQLGG